MNLLNPPSNLAFFIGFVVFVGIRHVFARRTRQNEHTLSKVDRGEVVLTILVVVGSLPVPIIYLFTPWLAVADYPMPPAVPWCGSLVMIAGLWLFWRSHADLGLNWSATLQVRKGHDLVRRGVYRSIRHPMYAAIWLWSIAQAMMLPNWIAGPSSLVPFALLYFRRLPREERMMRQVFADEYDEYARQTGRLWPRLTRK